jgi:hypothetical protein
MYSHSWEAGCISGGEGTMHIGVPTGLMPIHKNLSLDPNPILTRPPSLPWFLCIVLASEILYAFLVHFVYAPSSVFDLMVTERICLTRSFIIRGLLKILNVMCNITDITVNITDCESPYYPVCFCNSPSPSVTFSVHATTLRPDIIKSAHMFIHQGARPI